MGRQNKVGLDYFELDCHMDDKIELIEAEYGLKGFAIVVKLYQSIYSGFGYYCEWTPDISVLWARRLGLSHGGDFGKVVNTSDEGLLSGFPKNLINDVVAASIRRDIFSKELFNRYGILTSAGIQKRYLNATSKREKVSMKKEYLLISVPKNRENVVINSISDGINSISVVRNTQSKEEKRNTTCTRVSRFNDFFNAYPKQKNIMASEKEYILVLYNDPSLTEDDLIISARNYSEAVSILGTSERFVKDPNRFLSEGRYIDYLDKNYKKPVREEKKKKSDSQFNQFMQTDYDFEQLEKELLSN